VEDELIEIVLEELAAVSVRDVWLTRNDRGVLGPTTYVARSATEVAHVDKALASLLRKGGVTWRGDVRHDPMAAA
jgi:hypothetical protein